MSGPRRRIAMCFTIWAMLAATVTAQGFKFLEVKVVDPDGKPMADVPVEFNINNMKFPMPTDEKGIVAVNVPAGEEGELELSVQHPGYVAQGARSGKGVKTPDAFTIPMKKGKTIGGIVQDKEGKPIEGVKVEGYVSGTNRYDLNATPGKLQPTLDGEIAVTDAEGLWRSDMAPEEDVGLQLRFSHNDYVSDRGYGYRGGTWEELKSQKNVVVMDKGITISGTVVDGEDKPIAGAQIAIGAIYDSQRFVTKTDDEGHFEIPKLGEGTTPLTVAAVGFAPELISVAVSKGMEPVQIGLFPGNKVRFRVVDKDGAPVAGVRINPNEWRGTQNLEDSNGLTDDEGRWEWSDAPVDEIKYIVAKEGFFGTNEIFAPSDEERTITLLPEVVVNGTVIDKETHEPIKSFRYVEGVWWKPTYDTYVLQSHNAQASKDGKFRFEMMSACEKFCIRVDADGYRPLVSREIFPTEGEFSLDFELEKGTGPSGVVLTPDGKPAQGALTVLATAQQGVYLGGGILEDNSNLMRSTADPEGHFALPYAEGRRVVVALHDSGWAEYEATDSTELIKLTLTPWSTIEGQSLHGAQPVADELVLFHIVGPYESQTPRVNWSYQTETSTTGAFEFHRVRSGPITVQRYIPYAKTARDGWMSVYSHGTLVDAKPGKTSHVQFGGEGRHVKGQLTVAEGDAVAIDWNMGCVQLVRRKADAQAGNILFEFGKALAGGNKESTSVEPTATQLPESYGSAIAHDGKFEIFDVAPGHYDLTVTVYPEDASDKGWNPIASLKTTCEVTDQPDKGPFDLGTFIVPLVKAQK